MPEYPDELLTIDEAAERLRISRVTLFNLLKDGRLRKVKVGARSLIPASEISDFIGRNLTDLRA